MVYFIAPTCPKVDLKFQADMSTLSQVITVFVIRRTSHLQTEKNKFEGRANAQQ